MKFAQLQSYLTLIGFGFLCALVISWLLTPLVIRLGFLLGMVDQPDERRIHQTPTPRCGGLGVFAAYSLTLWMICSLLSFDRISSETVKWAMTVIPVSIPLIILGLIDDRWEISPSIKLFGQVVVSLLAWSQGINLGQMLGIHMPEVVDALATVFLFVAAMNAYNLIDGMDGVAGGLGAITGFGLGALNIIFGNEGMAVMCFALSGSCLGFLRYNFHPAQVFLGDTGSMYIGFVLMSLTLVAQSRTTAVIMLIIPLLTMGVPMIDTGLAIWRRSVRRAMNPENKQQGVSVADKDHLHHRLARSGLTQRRVAITLYGIQALLFSVGLLWVFLNSYRLAIFTIAFFVGSYVVLRYLASLEMTDSGRWIVDGIRKPGRMQLFNSALPLLDIFFLCFALLCLSWLLAGHFPKLSILKLIRETAAPVVGGPIIFLWATKFYRMQWVRARSIDFIGVAAVISVGLLIGLMVSPLPLQHSNRESLIISLLMLALAVPPMVLIRAFPRMVQDFLQVHDRKHAHHSGNDHPRVVIYGAGYGYTLITRAESFQRAETKRHYTLVGLIDDDPHMRHRLVHGHAVLGSIHNLRKIVTEKNVNEILVSTLLTPKHKDELLRIAEELNLRVTQSLFMHHVLRENPDSPA